MQGISLRYTLIVFTNRREIHWKPTHGGFFTQQSTSSKLLRHQYLSPQLNSKFIVLPPAIHTFNSFSASIFNLNGMVAVYPHVASRWAILCSQFRNLTDNMFIIIPHFIINVHKTSLHILPSLNLILQLHSQIMRF